VHKVKSREIAKTTAAFIAHGFYHKKIFSEKFFHFFGSFALFTVLVSKGKTTTVFADAKGDSRNEPLQT